MFSPCLLVVKKYRHTKQDGQGVRTGMFTNTPTRVAPRPIIARGMAQKRHKWITTPLCRVNMGCSTSRTRFPSWFIYILSQITESGQGQKIPETRPTHNITKFDDGIGDTSRCFTPDSSGQRRTLLSFHRGPRFPSGQRGAIAVAKRKRGGVSQKNAGRCPAH